MTSFIEQNQGNLHFCDYSVMLIKCLEEIASVTAEEISQRCGIPLARVNVVLECLMQDGYVIRSGEEKPTYALRYKDPQLGCLWCHADSDSPDSAPGKPK